MLIKVKSIAFHGIDVLGVDVEVNVTGRGLPSFDVVGLPSKAVDESRHRVKSAIMNCGFEFPNKKITVNLAPADINKEGSFYDLAIAIGIISVSTGKHFPSDIVFFGELSLAGEIRHTRGAFLAGLFASENHLNGVVVPFDSVNEVSSLSGIQVLSFHTLTELMAYFFDSDADRVQGPAVNKTNSGLEIFQESTSATQSMQNTVRFESIAGQENAKRILTIGAAGGHHIHLMGSPGVGKTMLAGSINSILPPLSYKESVEVTRIYSVSGRIPPHGGLITQRPFRSPHHTISFAGMVGGGVFPAAGEVTLAHRGVLFLDEFPEFSRQVLETLRQPLEAGRVVISRGRGSVEFPARFLMIAASNPCKCGYYGDEDRQCTCTEAEIRVYRKRISGPILDRIDLHAYCKPTDSSVLARCIDSSDTEFSNGVRSAAVRQRVLAARERQLQRYKNTGTVCNAEMSNDQVKEWCNLGVGQNRLWTRVVESFRLSNRSAVKILKIARTIADIDCTDMIGEAHLMEAVQYRHPDSAY